MLAWVSGLLYGRTSNDSRSMLREYPKMDLALGHADKIGAESDIRSASVSEASGRPSEQKNSQME